MISGGYDQTIRFWDLPAMDLTGKSFRSIEPPDDIIHTLVYSKTGDKFIMAGSSPQARVYDRDGHLLVEFVKGYPYITDMSSTKGHVSRVTCCLWHPTNKEQILTGSQDSSIRIWDINHHKGHRQIIKLRNAQGAAKAPVMACTMTSDGKQIVAASQDGSIQVFPAGGPFTRPRYRISAHENGSETAALVFKSDNVTLLSRGADDTLKIWDMRKLEAGPIKSFDLPNKYTEANVVWSPDEKIFAAGTNVLKAGGQNESDVGKIHFFDSTTLEEVKQITVSPESVVSLLWHPELNQIFAGCCDKTIHVFFDPKYSNKGILFSVSKAPKKKRIEDSQDTRYIMNPHALPMFKQPPSARRQREKARKDPLKAHIPEAPQIGPGVGGRLGSSLTASIMKNLVKKDEIDDDPRNALLKYAGSSSFWFKAYEETQPKPIFDLPSAPTTAPEEETTDNLAKFLNSKPKTPSDTTSNPPTPTPTPTNQ
uniref:Uncharacterized protein n=1 Tax=Arcella intermedia TaxID=1963864 RepID=A0A6B2L0E3_9EUKA